MRSRFGTQAGDIRGNPRGNQFLPNPARPLIAFFIMNIVAGALLTWFAYGYGPQAEAQLQAKPVEVAINSTGGAPTQDIVTAIRSLGRTDVQVREFSGVSRSLPKNEWVALGFVIVACFFLTGPFFFIYCVASWVVSKFE